MLPNWIYYFLGKKSGGGGDTPTPTPTPTGVVIPQGMKFRYSSALPENWENWDFSNITNFEYMFGNVTASSINFDFPVNESSISCNSMFRSSSVKDCVLNFNSNSNGNISLLNLFYDCSKLESIEINNLKNLDDVGSMFYGCSKLVTAPSFDTSSIPVVGNGFSQMFYRCTRLENVPIYDFSNYNPTYPNLMPSVSQMFYGCTSLTNQSLDNILQSCLSVKSTTASNRNLHYMGLTSYDSIIPTLPHYQDFIDAGWTIS